MNRYLKVAGAIASLLVMASLGRSLAEEGTIGEYDSVCYNSGGDAICTQHDYGPQGVGQCDCWDSAAGTCSIGAISGDIGGESFATSDYIDKDRDDNMSKPVKKEAEQQRKR